MIASLITSLTRDDLTRYVDACQTPLVRTISEFAAAELIIPEGKYKGTLWRRDTLPYAGLLFDAISSGRWPRTSIVGCVQGGKSLHGFVAPTMHHLFEYKETVILGAPTITPVGKDKWNDEILPAIRASRYKDLLPRDGSGSRGGWAEEIQFRHGPKLKFMSAAGGDATRSSYTSRVLVVTEADKMDTAGETSREADPVTQMQNRLASYDAPERRTYIECTCSVETGRIWQEYLAGSQSRIACPCPHCGEHVTPEREHLAGWQDAETKIAAGRGAFFVCPICEKPIDDAQRAEMNRRNVLLHRGQSIDRDGVIRGEPPETDTLSFRWNAFNNLFWTIGTIAQKEWEAIRAEDNENAEKELLQFYWVRPYKPPRWDTTPLDARKVRERFAKDRKGFVPADTKYLTMGVDIGMRVCWWILVAWRENGSGHVVDYGTFEVASDDLGVERALQAALRDFRDETVLQGWATTGGDARLPDAVFIDAGWQGDVIYAFCRESDKRFLPVLGRGAGQHAGHHYRRPTKTGREVKLLGEEYHVLYSKKYRCFVVEVNADYWKSWDHQRLRTPAENAGAITLYHSTNRNEHTRIAKHFTAEKEQEEFIPGKGTVVKWVRESRANHYLDALYNASAAAHLCGFRLIDQPKPPQRSDQPARPKPLTTPDGRAFLVTDR